MTPRKTATRWLLGSVSIILTLLLALLLVLPQLIDSESLRAKLQEALEEQTGGQVYFQNADLSFLPRPSVTLHQIKLDIPDLVQGTVSSLQVYPDLLALITGHVRLAKLILESPEVFLNLAEATVIEEKDPPAFTFLTLQDSLAKGLAPLVMTAPDLLLVINKGMLTLKQDDQLLGLFRDLALKLDLAAAEPKAIQAKLQISASDMVLYRNGQKIFMENPVLNGRVESDERKISINLENLALTKPALQLKGTLASSTTSPAFNFDVQGNGINVDATRKTVLALAGDTSPAKEIFDYLRAGTVTQLTVRSQGDTVSDLGDLKNIVINGHLKEGAVTIPEIELDLTEVNGDVVVEDGFLVGSRMSTRLEGSTGSEGTLKVNLSDGDDLFQLELMLNADLAQAQRILKRIVENPEFVQRVDNITNLQGTSSGKLILGDSLSDIKARVDVTDLNLSADYEGLPFPIGLTRGQVSFTENQVKLKSLDGTFGLSTFSGLTCMISWENVTHLDLSSGQFSLVMDELYPFVASFDATDMTLAKIKKITGRLNLNTLSLNGAVEIPESWQLAATGAIKDLVAETTIDPARIELAQGDFTLDAEMLSFRNLKMDVLDADLILKGSLKGFPQTLDQVELSLDGMLGKNSITWLRAFHETAETYTLRAPLTLSETKIMWQPDATTSFKGNVSVEKGPQLTLDITYRPEMLQVKKLTVKDQHSDAEIAFDFGQDEINLNFNGILQHQTLDSMFTDQIFGDGQVKGALDVRFPQGKQAMATVKGHLIGQGLVVPLSKDEQVAVEQISLTADGSQAKVDAVAVSWHDFIWDPVKATVDFAQDKVDVSITEAKLCGINSTGELSLVDKNLTLDLIFNGKGLDVTTSYSCLTEGRVKMTGTLDFSAKISSQGQAGELAANLRGPLEMSFTSGTIEQSKLLARTLEVLNVTEIVKGKLPDLGSTGFNYSTITVQGTFQGEKLSIEEFFMDGTTLDVLGKGELDFGQDTVDAELLAAPFKTVDTVVKNIPGVNYLLAGNLVTIPVSVKGNTFDPKVRVMSASSVGSGLLNLGGRVIKSPLKLIETIMPGQSGSKKQQ